MTTKRSCWYVLLIVRGGGFESGVVLNFTQCPQQSTSSLGSRSKELMGLCEAAAEAFSTIGFGQSVKSIEGALCQGCKACLLVGH